MHVSHERKVPREKRSPQSRRLTRIAWLKHKIDADRQNPCPSPPPKPESSGPEFRRVQSHAAIQPRFSSPVKIQSTDFPNRSRSRSRISTDGASCPLSILE